MLNFLYYLLVGGISGWLAGQFWKGSGFGIVGNIIIGIVGGVIGGWIAGLLGFSGGNILGRILISAIGAWILLFVIKSAKK